MRLIAAQPNAPDDLDWLVLTTPDNDVPGGPVFVVESAHATLAAAQKAKRRRPPARLPDGVPAPPRTAAAARSAGAPR